MIKTILTLFGLFSFYGVLLWYAAYFNTCCMSITNMKAVYYSVVGFCFVMLIINKVTGYASWLHYLVDTWIMVSGAISCVIYGAYNLQMLDNFWTACIIFALSFGSFFIILLYHCFRLKAFNSTKIA